jgi:hypothetical protein
MMVRPTPTAMPKRDRLGEELADVIIQCLALANAAQISIEKVVETRISMYEIGVADGKFDKPDRTN